MKTLYLATIVVLLGTPAWCKDEPATKSKSKRQVYYPPTYPESSECKSPPSCVSADSIPNQNLDISLSSWIVKPTLFYVTMETCWGYSLFANMLLGRKNFSPRELEEMCITTYYGRKDDAFVQTYSGYGNQIYQNCIPRTGSLPTNCSNIGGDAGTDWKLQGYELDYAVLSDGKSWVLYYRCVDGRYGDFQLYSTRPYVEQSVVNQVLTMLVTHLGFSATDAMLLQCMSPTYPVPLQNYPEPDSALSKSCSYPNSYSPPPPSYPPAASSPPHYNPHPNHPY